MSPEKRYLTEAEKEPTRRGAPEARRALAEAKRPGTDERRPR